MISLLIKKDYILSRVLQPKSSVLHARVFFFFFQMSEYCGLLSKTYYLSKKLFGSEM